MMRSPIHLPVKASLAALGLGLLPPLLAGQERPAIRLIHDLSGAYAVWSVVDSDGDGACDADETAAGTNPFDPASRPGLALMAELANHRALPSFEAGLGAFLVFPAAFMEMANGHVEGAKVAFPPGWSRPEAFCRLGISSEALKEHGIQPDRGGFTVGLLPPNDKGILPGPQVGGLEMSLISADGGSPDAGADDDLVPLPKNLPNQTTFVDEEGNRFTFFEDGRTKGEFADGSACMLDAKGNFIWRMDKPKSINPDTDTGGNPSTPPSEEEKRRWERMRGAVVRTVEGFAIDGPKAGDLKLLDIPLNGLIFVDPETVSAGGAWFIAAVNPPRTTTAQPETRPDLPNPTLPGEPPR